MFAEWVAEGAGSEQAVSVPGRPALFAEADQVTYRTTLPDPRNPADEFAILDLRGLFAHARIAIDGHILGGGSTGGKGSPTPADQIQAAGTDEDERIDTRLTHGAYFAPFRLPFVPNETTDIQVTCTRPQDRFGGLYESDMISSETAVPGIWWDAAVETGAFPYLDQLSVIPRQTDDGWEARVHTRVFDDISTERQVTYSVRPAGRSGGGGMMERRTIETSPGTTVVDHTVSLRDPARWYPRGYGDQNRHVLRAKLDDQERTGTFGVREVSHEDGALRINDHPVPIRGVTLLDATTDDIDRALAVNANLVRFRAHVPPQDVFQACDEAGLLVWQDLPLTGPGPFDIDRGRELARTLTRVTASHPSVATFAVHDEPVAVGAGIGDGLLAGLRLRYRAWRASYDDEPARDVAEVLPQPTFPAVGGPGLGCEAGAYYPGWQYGDASDIESILSRYPVPVIAAYGAPADVDHDDSAGAPSADWLEPTDQASVVRTISEWLRHERVGAIASALRDTDATGMGVYTVDGTPKPSRDTLSTSFEPVQAVIVNPSTGKNDVHVMNDSPRNLTMTVSWTAGDEAGEEELRVGPDDVAEVGPIRVPKRTEQISLVLTGETIRVENHYTLS